MRKIKNLIIFLFTLMILLPAWGKEIECSAVKWPYKLNQKKSEIHKIMDINKFHVVLFYYFYEVTTDKPTGLEQDLFKYLDNKSPNRLIKGFVEAINWRRSGSEKKDQLNISEICDLYKKTIEHSENNYKP